VYRGGSWDYDAAGCRAADRYRFNPVYRFDYLGFRPALVPSE
jgi:formylglycine-generating enzyme required for sulfatase activity